MATIEKISVALPPEMVSLVRGAVDDGDYASSSEVIREALRDWSRKRELEQQGIEDLRAIWKQARSRKGKSVAADEVMERLESKYKAIVEARQRG